MDCHSIHEALARQEITLPRISTEHQTADIFTKAISRHRHKFMIDKLMTNINLRGGITKLGHILYIAIVYIYGIFVVGRVMLRILNDLIEEITHVIIIIRL